MVKLKLMLSLIAMLVFGFGFSGCVPSYSIKPAYNEATKELSIDTIKFQDTRKVSEKNSMYDGPGIFHIYSASYYVDNNQCTGIFYSYMDAGEHSYIINNLKDMMESSVRQGKLKDCYATEIGNLVFYTCNNETYNRIGMSSAGSNGGYSMISRLILDYNCFNTIKKHFREKAKKDKIEIKEYKLENR